MDGHVVILHDIQPKAYLKLLEPNLVASEEQATLKQTLTCSRCRSIYLGKTMYERSLSVLASNTSKIYCIFVYNYDYMRKFTSLV